MMWQFWKLTTDGRAKECVKEVVEAFTEKEIENRFDVIGSDGLRIAIKKINPRYTLNNIPKP